MLTVWSLLHLILKVAQGYSQTPYSLAQLESPSHLLYLLVAGSLRLTTQTWAELSTEGCQGPPRLRPGWSPAPKLNPNQLLCETLPHRPRCCLFLSHPRARAESPWPVLHQTGSPWQCRPPVPSVKPGGCGNQEAPVAGGWGKGRQRRELSSP